jgi:hypothetical protein
MNGNKYVGCQNILFAKLPILIEALVMSKLLNLPNHPSAGKTLPTTHSASSHPAGAPKSLTMKAFWVM